MKNVLLALLVLTIVSFQAIPVAADIDTYSVNAVISDSTVAYNTKFDFVKPVTDMIFSIPGTPEDVSIYPQTCRIDKALLQTNILCNLPLSHFEVNYSSDERINRKSIWGGLVWSDNFKIPEPAAKMIVNVQLPAGAALKEPIADAIQPASANISSDGRHILISWSDTNVEKQWSGSIAYERIEIAALLPTLLAIIAVVVAVGVIAYRFYFGIGSKEGMKIILPILRKDEKVILDALMKHGSGVNQKIIVKESGYSKAKVSKVLKSLAERGLVKLERTGRSNRIFWGKKIKKEA